MTKAGGSLTEVAPVRKKKVWEAAIEILKETENSNVGWGDGILLQSSKCLGKNARAAVGVEIQHWTQRPGRSSVLS